MSTPSTTYPRPARKTAFLAGPQATSSALPPDNNASERALRIVALGRKNYLFVGNDLAGKHLADVLLRLASTPQSCVEELLPLAWKARHAPAEPRAGPDEAHG